MNTTNQYDVLVIGGGPAGISSAMSLSRTKRRVAMFDSGLYRNVNAATSHTIPGHDGEDPAKWRETAQQELLARYSDTFSLFRAKIVSLRQVESPNPIQKTAFEATDERGQVYSAKKVILALGVADRLTPIKGVDAIWGKQAIHCVYCHGTETAGHSIAFLLTHSPTINGMLLSGGFKKWINLKHKSQVIFTNGLELTPANGISADFLELAKRAGISWNTEKIAELSTTSADSPVQVSFEDNAHKSTTVDFIVTFAEQITPSPHAEALLKSLGEKIGTPHPQWGVLPSAGNADPQKPNLNATDPKTRVDGIYWAGNTGNVIANVNIAVVTGQAAGITADDALADEDLEVLRNQE